MTEQRAALAELARAAIARRSMEAFCERMDPLYESTQHTRFINDHLDALQRREIDKLILSVPPRHAKTYLSGERFPAFWLGRNPHDQIIMASYSIDRARASSRKARALIADERWPFFGVALQRGAEGVDEWQTTAGGVFKAAGVGGAVTGFGAHLFVTDDAFKGWAEASSPTINDATWEWFQSTARTRIMRGGAQLVVGTRWRENDVTGRILNSKGASQWTHLRLPAIAEDGDPLGRAIGDELWPGGMASVPSVALGEISSRAFASMYQGNPTPDDGDIFKREWFGQRYTALAPATRAAIWVDGAWKTGVTNDRSAIAVWQFTGEHYDLVHAWADRVEYPELRAKVRDVYTRFSASLAVRPALCVEDAASGTPLVQELRRDGLPIIGIPAKGSKAVRAEAIVPLFESKRVRLPASAPWLDDWIEEHMKFPAGAHDDFVDTTSGALDRLQSGHGVVFAEAI